MISFHNLHAASISKSLHAFYFILFISMEFASNLNHFCWQIITAVHQNKPKIYGKNAHWTNIEKCNYNTQTPCNRNSLKYIKILSFEWRKKKIISFDYFWFELTAANWHSTLYNYNNSIVFEWKRLSVLADNFIILETFNPMKMNQSRFWDYAVTAADTSEFW